MHMGTGGNDDQGWEGRGGVKVLKYTSAMQWRDFIQSQILFLLMTIADSLLLDWVSPLAD